jgi:hypothetical protein
VAICKRESSSKTFISSGFNSQSGAVSENPLILARLLSMGGSEKSVSACRKKVFLSERFEPTTLVPSIDSGTTRLS